MTMIEMVVALLISTLVILGVVNIYRFANKDWNDGMRVERLQQQTQYAMGLLEGDVRQATVTTMLAAGVTTFQVPMTTTDNGVGASGYGVIIIENVSTLGIATLDQVNYRLITSSGTLQLQRSDVGTYVAGVLTPLSSGSLTWKPVMVGLATLSMTPPFIVSTLDITTYTHQSLSINLMAQAANNVQNTLNAYAMPLITTLTMRGNAQVQYQTEENQ
jgi:competence protein ComGC